MNPVLENIMTRRSIRSYQDKPVSQEDLRTIVQAGRYAASGMNRQPWYFVAVQQPAARQALSQAAKDILGRPGDPFYDSPAVILVFGDQSSGLARCDCSLALGNMMLAAHSLGLGSCWINCVGDLFAAKESQSLRSLYQVPAGYQAVGSLAVGYVQGEYPQAKERKEQTEFYLL